METKRNINLSEEEISHIKEIQNEIRNKRSEINAYVDKLFKNYNLEGRKLCLLTYTKGIEIDKDKRGFLEPRKYEPKEFVRLAYAIWRPYSSLDGFKLHFYSVSNNERVGNEITLYEVLDFSYEILDCTVEEARKLLKDRKNNENSTKNAH